MGFKIFETFQLKFKKIKSNIVTTSWIAAELKGVKVWTRGGWGGGSGY